MSEKRFVILFLASAVLALSNFLQVSSDTNEKQYRGFLQYEEMYQNCVKNESHLLEEFVKEKPEKIDNEKSDFPEELLDIYEEIVEDTLCVSNFLGKCTDAQFFANNKEKVVLLFYIKYLTFYSSMLIHDVKDFVIRIPEYYTPEVKDEVVKYFNFMTKILTVYSSNTDYKEFIPLVKDLYLQKQRENNENAEEAEKLVNDVEIILKDLFEGENDREFSPETAQEQKKVHKLISTLLPEIYLPNLDKTRLEPDEVTNLVRRANDFKLFVKTPTKTSRINKIIQLLMPLEGSDIFGEDDDVTEEVPDQSAATSSK